MQRRARRTPRPTPSRPPGARSACRHAGPPCPAYDGSGAPRGWLAALSAVRRAWTVTAMSIERSASSEPLQRLDEMIRDFDSGLAERIWRIH